ncbi:MAG TPA: hypothetical protein VEK08_25270 [Planctomycetota bacterium]|nr:hypothetical protein [Planctomycetota bacterium]
MAFPIAGPTSSHCIMRATARRATGQFVTVTSGVFAIVASLDAASQGGGLPQSFVNTAALAPQAVTPDKIADGAVTSFALADGSVTTPKLAEGAVTSSKLGETTVTTPKVANKAIVAEKIGSGAASNGMVLEADGAGGASFVPLTAVSPEAGNSIVNAINNTNTAVIISPLRLPSNLATTQYVDEANEAQNAAQAIADLIQDEAITGKVSKAGDTMTGPLILSGDPTDPFHAATKRYIDNVNSTQTTAQAAIDAAQDAAIAGKVSKTGDTMSGPLTLNGDPSNPLHAATKQFVDSANSNQDIAQQLKDAMQDTVMSAKWALGGNAGTTASTHFLGTTDNQAMEIRVNNTRAIRFEPTTSTPNLVGGNVNNNISASVTGAVILGGGDLSAINQVTDNFGSLVGGSGNQTGDGAGSASDKTHSAVVGGSRNVASGAYSVVVGGTENIASGFNSVISGGDRNRATGDSATISGGVRNVASTSNATIGGGGVNAASGANSTVCGGSLNNASGGGSAISGGIANNASGQEASIAGGFSNSATGNHATVSGGSGNKASAMNSTVGGGAFNFANGNYSTIGGGDTNSSAGAFSVANGGQYNNANGNFSVTPGGTHNRANADYSFAAGYHATVNAAHTGTFLWADAVSQMPFSSTIGNEYAVRATGGVRLVTNIDFATGNPTRSFRIDGNGNVAVQGNVRINNATIRSGVGIPNGIVNGSIGDLFLRTDGGVGTTLYVKESGNATNTGWVAK